MLSIIIPVYNEEGAAEDIVRRADKALRDAPAVRLYEIIVIDDGSTDATPGILKKIDLPNLHIIRHSKNTGNGAAIMTGIHHAKGEWVATIDADDTYQPEDIPKLYAILQQEHADMIVGFRRTLTEGPWFHRTARDILRRWAQYWSGTSIKDINSGLRICTKELVERYADLYPKRFSLHIVLMVCAGRDGAKILYEEIVYGPRIGTSKLSCGIRGVGNFIKFLFSIPMCVLRKKSL